MENVLTVKTHGTKTVKVGKEYWTVTHGQSLGSASGHHVYIDYGDGSESLKNHFGEGYLAKRMAHEVFEALSCVLEKATWQSKTTQDIYYKVHDIWDESWDLHKYAKDDLLDVASFLTNSYTSKWETPKNTTIR